MIRIAAGALALLLLVPAFSFQAEESAPAPEKSATSFFSGTITAFTDDNVTVIKTVLGKSSETRMFSVTKETRIEGKLKLKARVTVRYTHDEDGNRALHIIVRGTTQKK